jgi:hypothetical protein
MDLVRFVRDFKFERMGAFVYSEEDGTPAAEFPEQVLLLSREEGEGEAQGKNQEGQEALFSQPTRHFCICSRSMRKSGKLDATSSYRCSKISAAALPCATYSPPSPFCLLIGTRSQC